MDARWLPSLGLASAAIALAVVGCKGKHADPAAVVPEAAASAVVEEPREAIDAGVGITTIKIAALESPTPVNSAPEVPPKDPTKAADERQGVIRLGYLRKGQVVEAKPSIIKKSNCPEGWYELIAGGFVCGKAATMDLESKLLANAPHAPYMDQALPYEYGLNLTNGAPAYFRRPTRVERKQYEAHLDVGPSIGKGEGAKGSAEEGEGGGTPWYLKDHPGSARPQVSLDELHGAEGPVKERMIRGFYVALDAPVSFFAGKMWRTTRGLFVPAQFLLVHKPSTEFEGVNLGGDIGAAPAAGTAAPEGDGGSPMAAGEAGVAAPAGSSLKLPLAWALAMHTRQYHFGEDGRAKRGPHVDRFTPVQLTGNRKAWEDRSYFETTEGWWIRDIDETSTKPGPPPKDLQPGEKWIDVNITTQTLVAYEGDKPVFATLVSSGRHDDKDPTKDHRTKVGSFRIREKHIAATMDADSSTDGPYSIQDVPWIMYFEGSYALHGAFWHLSFGHERSHGCVNLMPKDAHTLFGWTGPKVPEGWHGVRATAANPGTRVVVHE